MIKNKDSLKSKAKNLAKKYNIDSSYILQTYMFEALLKRISVSKYSDNLIIKGLWERYQNNYSYAKNITFEDTIDAINKINDLLLESE